MAGILTAGTRFAENRQDADPSRGRRTQPAPSAVTAAVHRVRELACRVASPLSIGRTSSEGRLDRPPTRVTSNHPKARSSLQAAGPGRLRSTTGRRGEH
jgi:hypothetical protein